MPFDPDKYYTKAGNGEVGGAYLNLAITITPIIAALEKIERKTGLDLSAERKRLQELNRDSFEHFKGLTGWEDLE